MYGRALYDYEARTTEELTIKEGMILLITDDSDPDWWDATLRVDSFEEGESGLVPVVYIEEATPIHMAKGLYDYDPNTSEEIKLREGDLVKVYEKVDNDWWFVKIENEVGLVPATYVEVEQESLPVPVGDGHKKDLSGEHQKMLLMGALDGLGFARKSESHAPTGMVYGPDDATYYPVLAVDKKKKKASEKGLLGVSLQDDTAYFLEPTVYIIYIRQRKSCSSLGSQK